MGRAAGIVERRVSETPISVLDLETTGLTAGVDRVVEVSVVRVDPGKEPRLVLDTLVNPMRPMAATEIHGITDQDVAKAPRFVDIAGELVGALNDSVLTAYNAYFDIKFLDFELRNAGIRHEPPYFCLMYMRSMLGLDPRCKLEEACHCHGIEHQVAHLAAGDAMASARLLRVYLTAARDRGVETFGDLAGLKGYKFVDSFSNEPFPHPSVFQLSSCDHLCSRVVHVRAASVEPTQRAFVAYWDTLKTVVADLAITDEECAYVADERRRLGLTTEQVRSIHAKAFASAIAQFSEDKSLDDREVRKLRLLHECLSKLGWAPGE